MLSLDACVILIPLCLRSDLSVMKFAALPRAFSQLVKDVACGHLIAVDRHFWTLHGHITRENLVAWLFWWETP